jgi:hypothetical protein
MLTPEEQQSWTEAEAKKIYRVLTPPASDRVWYIKVGYTILAGDYGWGAPCVSPPERVAKFITLEGSDENFRSVWMADFLPSEVEFAAPKPDLVTFTGHHNPFAVKPPSPSVTLYLGRLKYFFLRRWHWWKARHIRRENLLKYAKPKNQRA